MKLKKVKVTNFRSILDSTEVELDKITCLVGKNEAGKTAFLKAIEGFKSINNQFLYNILRDYPRRYHPIHDLRHYDGNAQVISTVWELDKNDHRALTEEFGESAITGNEVTISRSYNQPHYGGFIEIDHKAVLKHLYSRFNLSDSEIKELKDPQTTVIAFDRLEELKNPSRLQLELLDYLKTYLLGCATSKALDILLQRAPHFLYVNDYAPMSDKLSFDQIRHDKMKNNVSLGDQIFLDLFDLAEADIGELERATNTSEINARCEVISNVINNKVLKFWSQSNHIEFKLKIMSGWPNDPPPFSSGIVACAYVYDKSDNISLLLSERSSGFIWLFSFLVRFAQCEKYAKDTILLLDEPGLTIHGTAQKDLLRYFKEIIAQHHQLVYTTHSPYMVPPNDFSCVRTVEFCGYRAGPVNSKNGGTKVRRNFLARNEMTNLPVLGAMGLELTQNLLIGRNTLLVEGRSDIEYLQVFSKYLCAHNKPHLDPEWVICPVGGISNMLTFVSLFKGNNLNIVVLIDYEPKQEQTLKNLYKLLDSERIIVITEVVNRREADIEDLFEPQFFLDLVNFSYHLEAESALTLEKIVKFDRDSRRIVKKIKEKLQDFDHSLPSRYLHSKPELLDENTELVSKTVNRFEHVFKKIAKFTE